MAAAFALKQGDNAAYSSLLGRWGVASENERQQRHALKPVHTPSHAGVPLGWSVHTTPEGSTYYHNMNTGVSVWNIADTMSM